jgi:hypothetical protein
VDGGAGIQRSQVGWWEGNVERMRGIAVNGRPQTVSPNPGAREKRIFDELEGLGGGEIEGN